MLTPNKNVETHIDKEKFRTLKKQTKPYYWDPTLQTLRASIRKLHKKTLKFQHKPSTRQKLLKHKWDQQKEYYLEFKKAKTKAFRDYHKNKTMGQTI